MADVNRVANTRHSVSRLYLLLVVVAVGAFGAACGCSGSANIQMVSLHGSEIDPPGTKVARVKADEAYWFIDDDGELNISIRMHHDDLILGEWGKRDFVMSIVPGPPPNGRARNYVIKRDSTRTLWQTGLVTQRFASYSGVMAVYMDDDTRLHGSFRFWMTNPGAGMPIWFVPQTPGPKLVFGTLNAVKDEARCRKIREAAETNGWTRRRNPKPTTQPAK